MRVVQKLQFLNSNCLKLYKGEMHMTRKARLIERLDALSVEEKKNRRLFHETPKL
jgi:hypothetical protein